MYKVIAEPVGRHWQVEIPEIDRATQARTAREIPVMARDLIDVMTGEANSQIEIEYVVPAVVSDHLSKARQARLRETEARAEAARELRAAAKALRAQDLPLADVGAVLGVSHQRAHQLLQS
ncbi:MAG: hypothetical protein LBO20_00440 [Bifidobacteriaceae bacterium]|jgi:hypothetical protein|nr:hypothetical protein [Bifidobacteriaceae bacterium]